MDLLRAVVLGIVQGLTEFIPLSSSGHLVLVPWALRWPYPSVAFDTMLHWGTLVAILVYFWRDWLAIISGFFRSLLTPGPWNAEPDGRFRSPDSRLAWWLIIGSVPAAILGFLLNDFFASLFSSPQAVGIFLLVTALLLVLSERYARQCRSLAQTTLPDVLVIGLAQALAIAPGLSRSGTTMAAGLSRGLTRDSAARFSFLLGAPAIFGAGLFKLLGLVRSGDIAQQLPALAIGFLAAALTGYVCIRFLLNYVRRGSLNVFAAYCCVVGALVIVATLWH